MTVSEQGLIVPDSGELAMHTKAALRNGVTADEIREVLLQVGLYAGVPVANRAFAIANRAIDEYRAEQQA